MRKIIAYYGNGRGKTSAALGYAIQKAGQGKDVIMIQFLKQKDDHIFSFIQRLEPEIRFFRFQKSGQLFENLSPQQQDEEILNMKNGINYARKVLAIDECDILILDEVLGLVDNGILTSDELESLIFSGSESVEVILTGRTLAPSLIKDMDSAYEIITRRKNGQNY
jgi:cob(I)alamin adenosyltransferase